MIEYTGTISYVRFYSEETKFLVASFNADQEEKMLNITGNMMNVQKDVRYRITGDFTIHPRYGKQFQFQSYEILLADDREEIIRYLSSPLFKGIGKKQAELIVDTLGTECIDLIRKDISCLHLVQGMTEKKVQTSQSVIFNQDYDQEVLAFFMGHGISTKNLSLIQGFYKENTLKVLQENPYQLIDDIEGIGFKSADQLAMKLHIDPQSPMRISAALRDSVKQICFKTGSTFTSLDKIKRHFSMLIGRITQEEFDHTMNELVESKKIINENGRYYPQDLYDSELAIGRIFKKFFSLPKQSEIKELDEKIQLIEKQLSISYDSVQKNAINQFIKEPALVLTGGPGTGKTTIVQAILNVYKELHPDDKIDLVAPTGRAAKRLTELTHIEASTIHRLLKWDLHTNTFVMNSRNPLDTQVLIIDEFSMVDSLLFARLLEACQYVKKILIIGDEQQLPSVAPGNVLKDILESQKIPVIQLEKVYRQKQDSGIIQLAHSIRNDQYDIQLFNQYEDIHFIECLNYEVIPHILGLVQMCLSNGFDMNDIQVLSPMYGGIAGIDAINEALQSLFNPSDTYKNELKVGMRTFREGDKVLQLKNRPDDNVFNGDIGIIEEIIYKDDFEYLSDTIVVLFDGALVEYAATDLNQITHAYCMSVHKSQGNEFPVVIMNIWSEYAFMLRKNLLYTALTRAKKELFIIGNAHHFEKGLHQIQDNQRLTTLKNHLGDRELLLSDFIEDEDF